MFGSHLSIAGSMTNALREAEGMKMDCVQVFTKNQRQWRASPLTDEQISEWQAEIARLGWQSDLSHGVVRTVSHNSYLINMASPDAAAWKKSIALQQVEIERCEQLGIPCCVAHPGAHLGEPADGKGPRTRDLLDDEAVQPTKDELAGLKRIVKAIDQIHRALAGYKTLTCLETTVGSGTNLGYAFEHLTYIRENVREPERVGYCLDTCHVTAAGYDMTTDAKAAAVLDRFDAICGLEHVRVFHFNDSVGAIGSRRDRHAHIGDGTCGKSCFGAILNRAELASVPKILETPKEMDDKGMPMDTVNIRRLKRLLKKPQSTRPPTRKRARNTRCTA